MLKLPNLWFPIINIDIFRSTTVTIGAAGMTVIALGFGFSGILGYYIGHLSRSVTAGEEVMAIMKENMALREENLELRGEKEGSDEEDIFYKHFKIRIIRYF